MQWENKELSNATVIDCITNDSEHEWESVGTTERIDITTIGVLYECLKCGKTEFQYYAIEDTEPEDY